MTRAKLSAAQERSLRRRIAAAHRHIAEGERTLLLAVAASRKLGKTWAEIAERLECSPQAAWERYRDRVAALDPAEVPDVKW